MTFQGKVVKTSVRKKDSMAMAQGKPLYVADLDIKPLIAKVLRSPHAHANIVSIDTSKAEALEGVHAVVTYKDVPRIVHTTAGQGAPEPSPYDTFILDKKVRYIGDRVAVVAADTKEIAEKAIKLIKVEYEVLPSVLNHERSRDPDMPVIHDEEEAHMPIPVFYEKENNHVSHVDFSFGEMEQEFENSDFVVERRFDTQYAQHCPIEPHVCMAYYDEHDYNEEPRIIVRTSTQVPFHARRIIARSLGLKEKNIRVIKPRIGGGFGTKQEVLLEQLVVLLTMKTKKPVLLEFSRKEEFMSARTRHPYTVWVKAGVKKSGEITAIELKVLSNTGAYGSHGLTVMSNAGSKSLPLYHMNAVGFIGDTVYTNLPVPGAYRGYGATQACYGMEVVIDELAEKIGMDAAEFRTNNHIQEGEGSPVFKALGEGTEGVEQTIKSCKLDECITQGMEEIDWKNKRNNPGDHPTKKRGVGMAMLMQGSSIPRIDMASSYAKMNEDGSFNLQVGATDLGTGSDTVIAQIFAEALDISADDVIVYSSDTDLTPFDVGAYASSTTYLSGMSAKKTAEKIKKQILQVAAKMMEEDIGNLHLENAKVYNHEGDSVSFGDICKYAMYTEDQFQIQATASSISEESPPPFAAHFAEVEVDTETGQVKVVKYVAAVDCGVPINPKLAEGQTEGAVMNGISYALTEEFIFNEKGVMLNPSFNDYRLFTTSDMPELKTILVDSYEPTGPYGAKSISEININGPMPAIANAIYDAVGIRLFRAPFTPERVLDALMKKHID